MFRMRTYLTLFVLVMVLAIMGCSTESQTDVDSGPEVPEPVEQTELVAKELDAYSWEELVEISRRIKEAPDDETARQIAASFGLVGEDGRLTSQTKMIILNDTTAVDVRLAGIRHDDASDGSGKAGLTFMTVGGVDLRAMNSEATVQGGWEACELRSWLATELKDMLDDDLASALVPVVKLTNNKGFTLDISDVTPTNDELWLFSAREVCGDVHWDLEEYRGKMGYHNPDAVLNAEGEQYEVFAQANVTSSSDPEGFLSLANSTGASPWWYRTPYPFEWEVAGPTGNTGFFCQVRDSGFPESLGTPNVPAAVVVGFCV